MQYTYFLLPEWVRQRIYYITGVLLRQCKAGTPMKGIREIKTFWIFDTDVPKFGTWKENGKESFFDKKKKRNQDILFLVAGSVFCPEFYRFCFYYITGQSVMQ